MSAMPEGCVTRAELVAHYAAVRKRLMRSHLRVVPKLSVPAPISITIMRPAPELRAVHNYSQQITGRYDAPPAYLPRLRRRPSVPQIVRVVAYYFTISAAQIRSASRVKSIVVARHVVFYLCRELTTCSLPEIGRRLGDMDHTTVLSGVRRIRARIKDSPEFAAEVAAIRLALMGPP